MAFSKPRGREILKYFGQYGTIFNKCTELSHIAYNVNNKYSTT